MRILVFLSDHRPPQYGGQYFYRASRWRDCFRRLGPSGNSLSWTLGSSSRSVRVGGQYYRAVAATEAVAPGRRDLPPRTPCLLLEEPVGPSAVHQLGEQFSSMSSGGGRSVILRRGRTESWGGQQSSPLRPSEIFYRKFDPGGFYPLLLDQICFGDSGVVVVVKEREGAEGGVSDNGGGDGALLLRIKQRCGEAVFRGKNTREYFLDTANNMARLFPSPTTRLWVGASSQTCWQRICCR